MTAPPVRDAWLLPTLDRLLAPRELAELLASGAESYWERAVLGGLTTDARLLGALAERFRMRVADLAALHPQARELLPEALARRYAVVPVAVVDGTLEVATADPTDVACESALAFATGRAVRLVLASPLHIAAGLDALYRPAEQAIERIMASAAERGLERAGDRSADPAPQDGGTEARGDDGADRPVIHLVDHILAEGIAQRASDVHLEPEEDGVAVRYRIDGVLRQTMQLPRAVGIPLVSRVKIMARMDIADRLRPQDGRAQVQVHAQLVDLRVSTLPAAHGEKVVIRILDAMQTELAFDALGLLPEDAACIERLIALREGLVLVTGPTGSGKTTTLYTALRCIQQRGVNVVTVEDPVEYRLPGVVQVQVNEKAGLTFAAALRSILRQDPDVVLVGEIRDRETAGIAVQASLTGHLVLSTLHTIDAASSVARLVDVGVESYKIAAALKGVVAQRLVRRLCAACRRPALEVAPRLRPWFAGGAPVHCAVGCAECGGTGYRGRVAVTETLMVGDEVERLVAAGASVQRVVAVARERGMRTLWESGVAHALAGTTSAEEVLRVLEVPADDHGASRPASPSVPPPAAPAGDAAVMATSDADVAFVLLDDVAAATAPPASAGRVLLVGLLVDRFAGQLVQRPAARPADSPDAGLGTLAAALRLAGFAVSEAHGAAPALALLDRDDPDVVVLHLDVPDDGGLGLLRRLRMRRATSAVPV
ncbi:MAG TPA: GspE/PulE family protein, partial [Gemmatimonadaceae bacterium]|nr:GspE/PulE family protein [Gemmatimonadaceae bacterium]